MIICKSGDEKVAVVIVWLEAQFDVLVVTRFLCCLGEVLWKKLALLVEVVARALYQSE